MFLKCTMGAIVCLLLATQVFAGNPYPELIQHLAGVSYRSWQISTSYTAAGHASQGSPAAFGGSRDSREMAKTRQRALQEYLAALATAMRPSATVAHIPSEHPVPVNQEQKWTHYYALAKNSLRPRIEYMWRSNATGKTDAIVLTGEYVDAWRANFDVFMWYRAQLGEQAEDDQRVGAAKFKLFLDYIVADLAESLPDEPKIDTSTGSVSTPCWDLNEKRLREQVVVAYRYLLAKYQVYPQYEQFAPADTELLSSLAKLAILMGAQINEEWFQDMEVDLERIGKEERWKRPVADAMRILQAEAATGVQGVPVAGDVAYQHDKPCIIAIPSPRPKAPPATPASSAQPRVPQVEIVIRHAEP
jgi:hypothetical protein